MTETPVEGHELPATIVEALPNELFRLELDDQSRVVAHVGAKRANDFLRLLPGDRVNVVLSPSDVKRGRITRRYLS